MKEIKGELWDYYDKPDHVICITTNGIVKKTGECVMGRGCAFEATRKVPGIAKVLGQHIKSHGNVPAFLVRNILSFPVKHHWIEEADLQLIEKSAMWLDAFAELHPMTTFILPRPGCGNGRLTWEIVKPVIEFLPDNVWVISR